MHHMYHELSEHLARHPAGFPTSAAGPDFDILKRLFTKEEAELALHLNLRLQTVKQVAEKAGIAEHELAKILAKMADKGIIFEDKRKGEPRYSLVAFLPGIYEFQVRNLDEQLAHAFEEIYPEFIKEIGKGKTPFMRVLPAEQSIADMTVIPYEKASEMVSQVRNIAITDCVCRKEQKLIGRGCSRPLDSICMWFGTWADFVIDKGMAQKATLREALKVLQKGENAGLVHLGMNVTENMMGMCQCCPCCCGVMRGLTQFNIPTVLARSNYYSVVDVELCNGCENCIAACPVKAISTNRKEEKAAVDAARCIGCGLCIVECATGALSLIARNEEEIIIPPRDGLEMWRAVAEEKKKTYFFTQ